jgi:predicted nucleic acid-binding protein
MKPLRVYIDTSVVGGCLDPEFRAASVQLFERFRDGSLMMVASDLLESELKRAPPTVFEIMEDAALQRETVLVTREAILLARLYIEAGVIGRAKWHDALHVATASVHRVDVLVSWDFKHIVNRFRVRGVQRGECQRRASAPRDQVPTGGVSPWRMKRRSTLFASRPSSETA